MNRKSHKAPSLFSSALASSILFLLNVSSVTPAQANESVLLPTAAASSYGKPDPDRIIKRHFPRKLGKQMVKGVVRDSANPTGQPIANARVTLIQSNGEMAAIETTTDPQGEFVLWLGKHTEIDSEYLAVSVSAENFRPREVNVSTTQTNSILMSLVNTFTYFEPVQLDDGIQTRNLNYSSLDPNLINQLIAKTVQPGATGYRELHSLLIYKDGRLVVEEYYWGNNDYIDFEGGILRKVGDPSEIQWGRTNKHYIASVNKSLTATVTGIALEQFGHSPATPISALLPEKADYFTDANKAAVTLHDMLTMQLGFVWDEWGRNDLTLLWQSADFTDFLLSRNNRGPQSAWVYNSASPNMLLRGLDNMVPGSIRDWADTHFYSKLGITDYDWQSQPDGLPEGAARMHMRPRDLLKVGVTYLNNGVWDDEQVIPENWVEEVSSVQVNSSAGDYSYFFWMRELNGVNYLSADGDGGQYINIFPEQDMVIVMTQGNYLRWPLYVNQANDMMGEYILPAVKPPIWSEEFNSGSALDTNVWSYDLGQTGWDHGELQEYTRDAANVRVEDGNLIITAVKDDDHFTSARVKTQDKFTFTYGTVEARIKLPDLADGLLPAFWTLGNNFSTVGWPRCGEIDVMEVGGIAAIAERVVNRRVGSGAHYELNDHHEFDESSLDRPTDLDGTFAIYRMEWTPTAITTYIDDHLIWTFDISSPEVSDREEFHEPHFFILNMAVGGSSAGISKPSKITASFPAEYVVDYIRIFDNGHTVLGNPPVFTTDPVIKPNAPEFSPYSDTLAGSATDVDAGDSLTYSKVSGPAWLNVAADGALSGTPGKEDVGLNSWTVQVSDGNNAVSATLELTVDAVPPVFTADPITKPNAVENNSYISTLAGSATDMDASAILTYSRVSGPTWLFFHSSGLLFGTPRNADVGLNSWTVQVSDGNGGTDTATLEITVDAPSSANLEIAVTSAIPPTISIQVSGFNLEVLWPASYTAYSLYSSTNLTPPVVWSSVTNTPIIQGDDWMVTIPIGEAPPFFQLESP